MKQLWVACGFIVILVALSASVQAGPVTITDVYIGAKNYSNWDSLGGSDFDISKMVVTFSNNLTVDIFTQYVNHIGSGGTGMGDLFISTNGWSPYGSAPYTDDDWSNSKQWEYVLKFDAYPGSGTTSGFTSLYTVDPNDPNKVQTSWSDNNSTYRIGQEVRYLPGGQALVGSGTWSIFDGSEPYLRFSVSLDSGPLQGVTDFGFHWTMTCGNDVIEGEASREASTVPEPASIILFATGLLSIAYVARKKVFA